MNEHPTRKGFRLNEAGETAYLDFLDSYGDRGCTCFISPPCNHCTHEGNPTCVEETDEFWEPDTPDPMEVTRDLFDGTPRRSIWDGEHP